LLLLLYDDGGSVHTHVRVFILKTRSERKFLVSSITIIIIIIRISRQFPAAEENRYSAGYPSLHARILFARIPLPVAVSRFAPAGLLVVAVVFDFFPVHYTVRGVYYGIYSARWSKDGYIRYKLPNDTASERFTYDRGRRGTPGSLIFRREIRPEWRPRVYTRLGVSK